jgi:transcriptional regulator with XRE-family HTH domain
MRTSSPPGAGALLRDWRRRRRLSQLDLALEAGVSTRHLSFVETGRSQPSADMVLQLTEVLDVPLRERNEMLLAAGYAPRFGQLDLDAPEMGPVREMIDLLLGAHAPFPTVVVDRHWGLVAGTPAVALLTEGVAPELLEPPANVLRLALHPDGMAPRIVNLAQWRAHLLERLARHVATTGDPALATLHAELEAYPAGDPREDEAHGFGDLAVPLVLRRDGGPPLRLISTVTTFGTPLDVTVSELSIESFLPADPATAAALRAGL